MDESTTEATRERRNIEIVVLSFVAVTFLGHMSLHGYQVVAHLSLREKIPWTLLIPAFTLFSIAAAMYMIGWRRTLVFFALTCVISYVFELVGQETGLIFGRYHYTDVLGPRLGPVPLIIPLAYFMLMFPCYVITNLILHGWPTPRKHSLVRLPGTALLTALIMTAWDVSYDPLMADGFEAWKWEDGGRYFGIPFRNFFGWVLTCFVIAVAYGLAARKVRHEPMGPPRRWVALTPIAAFAVLGLGDTFVGYPEATRVITPFTMGISVLAALLRLYSKDWEEGLGR